MTPIRQLATRPRHGPLGQRSHFSSRLLKCSSQSYARSGQVFPPQKRERLNPVFRHPLWSSYRNYNYGYYNPESVWARNKSQIIVGGVVALCCGTFFCQWTAQQLLDKGVHRYSDLIRQNFINSAENIREGRWWVVVSSSLAHGNLLHLGLNMYVLWGVGTTLIRVLGVPGFFGLWVAAAAACSFAQVSWQGTRERLSRETVGQRWDKREDPTILGIRISRERALAMSGGGGELGQQYGGNMGASGSICGLIGTLICLSPNMPTRLFYVLPMPLWGVEALLCSFSLFCMSTGYAPSIGHAGHLGGTAAGIAYYYGVARPWLRRTGRF